jgi:MoaA/NifB/PqqE/SkfB family radical SAM enzyme
MKDKLDFEMLKSLLLELRVFGVWRISLTGGEPFFWRDIGRLLKLLSDLELPFSITTNGFASKQIFDYIEPFVWKTGTLYVSIDGDKQTHNSFRGERSYENAMTFLKHVRPKVNKLFVNTVLFTNPNEWAEALYSKLNNIGVDNWTIISPVKQGRWTENIDTSISFIEQYDQIKLIVKGKTTSTFLDFAESDSKLSDVVFIDSDGSIRLPGYFDGSSNVSKPLSYKTDVNDLEAASKIVSSVTDFIDSENYIL